MRGTFYATDKDTDIADTEIAYKRSRPAIRGM
jgi:hypothetical protein